MGGVATQAERTAHHGHAELANSIELRGVTKHYRGGGGIDDVALEVRRGEVFGFLGPNGAGKTTTIRLLLDLIRPDAGEIRVLGLDARRDSVAIRRRVGYLPGDLTLYERLSPRELLTHFAHLRGGPSREAIGALCDRFGLELDRPIRALSRGNRQKVGLVQALMGDPDLLILDEPTAGLDPIVQQVVHAEIRRAAAEGRSAFLSSHILPEVARIADRVGLIRAGRVIAVERVDELRGHASHTVDARFRSRVDRGEFARLSGVSECRLDGGVLHLEVTGSLDPIVRALARHDLDDLTIQEPDLEEQFLTFYGGDHG